MKNSVLCCSVAFLLSSTVLDLAVHAADKPPSPEVRLGWGSNDGLILLGELNCVACHAVDGLAPAEQHVGGTPFVKQAPRLGDVGARVTPQYLRAFLSQPHAVKPGTSMPDLLHDLTGKDRETTVDALLHFLVSMGGPIDQRSSGASMAQIARGNVLYHSVGCVACHQPQGPPPQHKSDPATEALLAAQAEDEPDSPEARARLQRTFVSIPHGDLTMKTTVEALATFLVNPLKVRPSGRMPALNINSGEARMLAAYLLRDQYSNKETAPGVGLDFAYFPGSYTNIPDFEKLTPLLEGDAKSFDLGAIRLPNGKPPTSKFAVRFRGLIVVPVAGDYRFWTKSDDGSLLHIDGKLVVNNDGQHPPTEKDGRIQLTAGRHVIEVGYTQGGGGLELGVFWQPPGAKSRTPIPPGVLLHSAAAMIPKGAAQFTIDAAKVERGRTLFGSLGCANCHDTAIHPATTRLNLGGSGVTVVGIDDNENRSPANEAPKNATDNNVNTKYLNFGKENSGLVISLGGSPVVVAGLSLTSANDYPERDPASYLLEGSTDGKNFERIDGRPVPTFADRLATRTFAFENAKAYTRYRITFPSIRDGKVAVAMQIAEVQLVAASKRAAGIVSRLTARPLSKLAFDAAGGCLSESVIAGRPRFGLSERQRAGLRTALAEFKKDSSRFPIAASAFQTKNAEQAARLADRALTTLNCYACHSRQGKGGPDRKRDAYFSYEVLVDLGDEGRLPPALNEIGAKLTTAGFDDMLFAGQRYRTYMAARMPQYGKQNIGHVPVLLAAADAGKIPTYKPTFGNRMVDDGRFLVGKKALACVNCHAWGSLRLQGAEGLDLVQAYRRLQPNWFHQFMIDPQQLRARTRMPTAWPQGNSLFPKLQDGDMHQQIDSIWAYLSVGLKGGTPRGLSPDDKSLLVPGDEPIVFRTFLDQVSAHAILVGFRQRTHVAFDANRVRMALAWTGDFVSAKPAWDGRAGQYAKVLGSDIVRFPDGPPLATLESLTDTWPADIPKAQLGSSRTPPGWRFLGYRFGEDRVPTFLYRVGDVDVEETPGTEFRQDSAVVTRKFRLTSAKVAENLYLRVAAGKTITEMTGTENEAVYLVDDRLTYRVRSSGNSDPTLRTVSAVRELIVPIEFRKTPGGKLFAAEVEIELTW